MNILHDKSSVKSSSAKWIDRGYAREDVHSLRLQYVYTPEQREANRQICDDGPDEAHRRIKRAAESKNAVMASVMAAIAREFICYQYESEDPAPYGSSRWELFFWCNDFSNTLHGYGLSGRDYSYFTLSFNLAQTVEQRAAVCGRVLQFLETRFHSNPNLEVAVQYTTWYDKGKIKADAKKGCNIFWMAASTPMAPRKANLLWRTVSFSSTPSMPKNITTVWTILIFSLYAGNWI